MRVSSPALDRSATVLALDAGTRSSGEVAQTVPGVQGVAPYATCKLHGVGYTHLTAASRHRETALFDLR